MAKKRKHQVARFTLFGDNIPVTDFGASIPVEPGSALDSFMESIQESQRLHTQAMEWMNRKMWHSWCHEERSEFGFTNNPQPDPDCYFCSWGYKFNHFFHEVWYWQRLCDGCDRFQWHCSCEPECEC